jgi:hypothetical protein
VLPCLCNDDANEGAVLPVIGPQGLATAGLLAPAPVPAPLAAQAPMGDTGTGGEDGTWLSCRVGRAGPVAAYPSLAIRANETPAPEFDPVLPRPLADASSKDACSAML